MFYDLFVIIMQMETRRDLSTHNKWRNAIVLLSNPTRNGQTGQVCIVNTTGKDINSIYPSNMGFEH